jgi:hypothetical protein
MDTHFPHFLRQMARRPSLGLLQNLLGRPPWRREPNELPWTDRPDALARIEAEQSRGRFDAQLAGWLRDWVQNGYVIVDDTVSHQDIDAMNRDLDRLWTSRLPRPGLHIYDLHERDDEPVQTLTHAKLLRVPADRRARMRDASQWRTHSFYRYSLAALRLFRNRRLRRLVSTIFGQPARPFASINFQYGSGQALHQDMAVFHIYPHNYLIGAWLACEDISREAGPLLYLPGSHRAPFFSGFTDYPQTNLRTVSAAQTAAYQRYVQDLVTRYPQREFLARKGQVLLWHGMLLHGGSPIEQPERTRRSFVIHYSTRHAERSPQTLGPFNWS